MAARHENVAAFWRRIELEGAPLIEALPSEPETRLVTFVFRGRADTRSVVVVGGPAGFDIPNQRLERLGDTDLWFRSYRVPRDARAAYELSENGPLVAPWQTADFEALFSTLRPDPLNPSKLEIVEALDARVTRSLLELPDAPSLSWGRERPGVTAGSLVEHMIESVFLDNRRPLLLYTPHAEHGAVQALLFVFDGVAFTRTLPTPTILDNLIADRRIPPTAAVFVDSLGARRNLELPCYAPFASFVAHELLPWARARCGNVPAERTVLAGASYGGAASSYIAQAYPRAFGNVLSLSGSFWVRGDSPDDRDWAWLPRRFERAPSLPLGFYQCVGLFEEGARLSEDAPEQLSVNRWMRDVLKQRGYASTYREYAGGHDYVGWELCLPEGLEFLLGA